MVTATAQRLTDFKVLQPSGDPKEDEAVNEFIKTLPVPLLPAGIPSLKLFWTFISDGSLNVLESTPSREADEYNFAVIGGVLLPTSNFQLRQIKSGVGTELNFDAYMADLQRRIKRAWFPPRGVESKKVVATFCISRGGEMSDLKLERPSGSAAADAAALQAISNAAPFRPLASTALNKLVIQFVFDYDKFSGGARGTFKSF